jgi:hypothetical protein
LRVFQYLRVLAPVIMIFVVTGAHAETPKWQKITIFQPHDQAIASAFADADTTWAETWTLSDEDRTALVGKLGEVVTETSIEFHRGRRGSQDLGWVLVLDEIGLYAPITHLIKVGPDRRVSKVQVLVFRETRGDGIKRSRFLRQFRGQSINNRMGIGRGIDGVTGATLSSQAIVRGVRKALELIEARYDEAPKLLGASSLQN